MKRTRLSRVGTICLFAACFGGPASGGAWDSNTLAGAAKVVITPPSSDQGVPQYLDGAPVYMAGFDSGRAATGVHDDLFARAAVIDIGGTRIALVTLDLVGYMVEEVQDVRRLLPERLGVDRLIVASTHNHEGPDTMGLWGWNDDLWPFIHPGVNDLYLLTLKRKIVEAVELAVVDLRWAGLRAATAFTDELELIRDTREPEIIDEKLAVLQAVELGGEGEVITTLINWSSHAEVLGDENTLLTADYPGYVCSRTEEQWGGTALFIAGAVGGLMTPKVSENTFSAARRLGHDVANLAIGAIGNVTTLEMQNRLDIRSNEDVDLFLMNPMLRLLNELWRRSFRTLHNCGPFGWFCRDLKTEVNLISIEGLMQLITVPGEIVPELSYDLLRELDAPNTMIVGLGNDEIGYILPVYKYRCNEEDPRLCWKTAEKDFKYPDDFFDPGDHYEETVSVGPNAAPVIMNAIFDLIAEYEGGR